MYMSPISPYYPYDAYDIYGPPYYEPIYPYPDRSGSFGYALLIVALLLLLIFGGYYLFNNE